MSGMKNNLWFGVFLLSLILLSLVFLFLIARKPAHVKPPVVTQEKVIQEKLLAPEVKHAINQALAPEGATYPQKENAQGITIDVSQRAASVATAVIDEKGKVHIQDYTAPLKE